jgi:protein-tyrosine phosphatase
MTIERSLRLVGAPNTRDLGGLTTADGRRVRPGALVRAGALGRVTDDDLPVLAKLGLACRIDLRHDAEIAHAPPDRLPEPVPRPVRLPVFDPSYPAFTHVLALLGQLGPADGGGPTDGDGSAVLTDSPAAMAAIYQWFVSGERASASFAAAVRAVAEPANLPVLFHCSAGKDRTGWLTVILLTALGVDRATIREDYLRTNTDNAALQQVLVDLMVARRPEVDVAVIRPMLEARPEYLDAGYAEVERRYGSFDAYLRTGLGLDDRVLTALRTQLLV